MKSAAPWTEAFESVELTDSDYAFSGVETYSGFAETAKELGKHKHEHSDEVLSPSNRDVKNV
jgi:hypothetical protein